MRTEKQIAVSRLNGAKSRGPGTSNPNAQPLLFKASHRALADIVVHPDESRKSFLKLCVYLEAQFAPENAVENLIVGRIAVAHWRQLRFWRRERDAARLAAGVAAAQTPLQAPDPSALPSAVPPAGESASAPLPNWEPLHQAGLNPTRPAAHSPHAALETVTAHRLDTAFFRALTVFYRVRGYRTGAKSSQKAANLMKTLEQLRLVHPAKNPANTRENSEKPGFELPPDLLRECL